ncbi:Polyisoprenyl-teichoic acid--peptidoglycan teichoic acid transferase TagU [Paraconexibacter sp. AEG42_29]|uniref:Polyisoprenyl-teichoic acid--peptidoglycan teichoic acid transferase TagU n=1 Tax=Paraconexibacter sp. AEG42_29 TaxID=2997339 RepID=A0AAU7ATG6_9ACTN
MSFEGGLEYDFQFDPSGDEEDEGRPPRAGTGLYVRFVLAGVLICCLTSGAVATAGLLKAKDIAQKLVPPGHAVQIDEKVITQAKPGKPQTILLVGSDKRFRAGKDDARSDTMMLVRLDPRQKATAVMSIPRDLITEIPGEGFQKINGAYSLGGLELTLKTVRQLLSGGTGGVPRKTFEINHAVGVNFSGFRKVVNFVGCVYTDVDRRYYHSNVGLPPSAHYAEIDIQPGYQKLCGQRALDYVRFRHLDNDIVRAARQQDFLRSAKSQIGSSHLLKNYDPLVEIIGQSTEADAGLGSTKGFLSIAKLAVASAGHPVREIKFPATFVDGADGSYVSATPQEIADAVHDFLHAKPPPKEPVRKARAKGKEGRKRAAKPPKLDPAADYRRYGLRLDSSLGQDVVAPIEARGLLSFRMYYPKALTPRGRYATAADKAPMPRVYTIRDRADKPHLAYRIVVVENPIEGQYYGIQGTSWKNPPILDSAFTKLRMRGRTFELHYDGRRIRTIAWRSSKAVYWVSNTLSLKLSNIQMRGLARSLTRIGER